MAFHLKKKGGKKSVLTQMARSWEAVECERKGLICMSARLPRQRSRPAEREREREKERKRGRDLEARKRVLVQLFRDC